MEIVPKRGMGVWTAGTDLSLYGIEAVHRRFVRP